MAPGCSRGEHAYRQIAGRYVASLRSCVDVWGAGRRWMDHHTSVPGVRAGCAAAGGRAGRPRDVRSRGVRSRGLPTGSATKGFL